MAKKNDFNDPTFTNCAWIGKGQKTEGSDNLYYEAAEVVRISDGLKRTFQRGDAVYVAGEKSDEIWIAHLVELFDLCDNSVESMRCTLRWLYDPPKGVPKPRGMKAGCREVYFSDHVEGCSNSLTAIHGRAFLCASLQEMNNILKSPPKNYWEGDVICLVRFFYYSNFDKRVRLKNGELKFLLSFPSTDPLHDVIAPVSEETGSEMNTQTGSKSVSEYAAGIADGHVTLKSQGVSRDHATGTAMDKVPVLELSPGKNRRIDKVTRSRSGDEEYDEISLRSRDGKNRRRVLQEISENDSDALAVAPSRAMRPTSRGALKTSEKSSKFPKHPLQMTKSRVQEVTRSPMEIDTGNNDDLLIEPDAMQMAWDNVEESFKSIPPDEPPFTEDTFKTMLNLMTSAMIERQLDFDMGEGDMKAVATLAAHQMFGKLAVATASGDVASRSKSPRSRRRRVTTHQ